MEKRKLKPSQLFDQLMTELEGLMRAARVRKDADMAHNLELVWKIYCDNKERIITSPGSSHNHQICHGGYIDHMGQMRNVLSVLWHGIPLEQRFYGYDDVFLMILLHDLHKPWKYVEPVEGPISLSKFKFSPAHKNALKYVHGEGSDYRSDKCVMWELAAFVHVCDVWSARVTPRGDGSLVCAEDYTSPEDMKK